MKDRNKEINKEREREREKDKAIALRKCTFGMLNKAHVSSV